MKQLAARVSLQHPTSNQMLTPTYWFRFCDEKLQELKFFIAKKIIESIQSLCRKQDLKLAWVKKSLHRQFTRDEFK